ncbi:MAG: PadR family transcriptional regulator [Nitrososphaerota archaeon]|nr:PadR family transcriptional regulator [Nitrososphaerota archaeon]
MWMDWTKRAHRGLRTWILMIVTKQPMNGAEIMDAMESGSRGWWRPSPGSVYPMLQQMAEEGLVKKRKTDNKYEITPQGRAEADWPAKASRIEPRSVEGTLGEISNNLSYLEDLAQSKDEKLAASAKQIRELATRVSRLEKSL